MANSRTSLSNGNDRACVGVVAASGGYPASYATGYPISGIANVDYDATVFHAGTKRLDESTLTDGGRVLTVSALADTHEQARIRAYESIKRISFKDGFYRSDIAATV